MNEVLPAAAVTGWFDGVTLNVGIAAACVTVIIMEVSPVTETVTLATLVVNKVFCV